MIFLITRHQPQERSNLTPVDNWQKMLLYELVISHNEEPTVDSHDPIGNVWYLSKTVESPSE